MSYRGNLVKKLNSLKPIDWFIMVGSIMLIVVGAILLFRKNEYKIVTIKVGEDNIFWPAIGPRKLYANLYHIGMKETSGFGKTDAEVLRVYSYDTDQTHKNVYLTVKVKTVFNRSSKKYIYKGKPLVIGSTIRFYLGTLLTDGLITSIEGERDTRINKIITVDTQLFGDTDIYPQTNGVFTFLAEAIPSQAEIRDDQGNIKVQILDKRIEDAKQLTTTSDGRMIVTQNPLRKDVFLKLKIYGFEQNKNLYMFDDIPIYIENSVPIHLPTIDIYPTVINIVGIE